MKLFLVKCRGMQSSIGSDCKHGVAYVVASDPTEAYSKLRGSLDKRDIGFGAERELQQIELLADSDDYPNCGMKLYL